jgi:hypothetical protein
MLPTFCDLAGAETPDGLDGISFAPTLLGRAPQPEHPYLYWETPGYGGLQAVRQGRWKAVRQRMWMGNRAIELYDLERDIGESEDVSSEYPEVVGGIESVMKAAHVPSPLFPHPVDLDEQLFNGVDLAGWWGLGTEDPAGWQSLAPEALVAKKASSLPDIEAHWSVEDGVLVNDGAGLYLTTDEDYGDFELAVEYRTVAGTDSGIYLRGIPQVQIWDFTEAGGKWHIGADKGSGGLWNNSPGAPGKDPLVLADRSFGQWNEFRIMMLGERVTVQLNDALVVDHARLENYFDRERPIPRRGPVQLQTHGGEIRWRNVHLRNITPAEAVTRLRRHGKDGFHAVFNGRDLEGWEGATDAYEVRRGAIRCKPGQGGTLYTSERYGNFVARFEFRLPEGGNNGLAIRYPGQGDPAYAGMCELQVLDNTHPKYAKLDPRQYHGSVYGQVPAARGYLHPPGTWNFQEVTVIGSTIRVELNGTRILDADLADVTDFMLDPERFAGRRAAEGHFGFAGHGDAVEFRHVRIRRLD